MIHVQPCHLYQGVEGEVDFTSNHGAPMSLRQFCSQSSAWIDLDHSMFAGGFKRHFEFETEESGVTTAIRRLGLNTTMQHCEPAA